MLLPQFTNQVAHFKNLRRVQTDGRLIQDEHVRFVNERLRQAYPLAHTLRKTANEAFCALFQIHLLENVIHAIFGIGQMSQIGHEFEVLENCHVGIQRHRFGHIAYPAAYFQRLLDHIETGYFHLACGRRHIAAQNAHGSGLPCAIGTQEAKDLAFFRSEAQIIDRPTWAVIFDQSFYTDHI